MAHQNESEAADDIDSAAAAINDLGLDGYLEDDDKEQQSEAEGEGSDDDLELDDEDGDDEDRGEPAKPAIEPPLKWPQEAKDRFAKLPEEDQRFFVQLEAQRSQQVTERTTKASEAQRAAESAAARADATAQARFAQQFKTVAAAYAPQRPDPALAQSNPGAYIAMQAQYEDAKAQHDELMQQAESLGTDADQQMTDADVAQRDRELMAIPEVANEATREEWFRKALGAADVLGLDKRKMDHASAAELKALHQVAGWREKAEKYDAATARQMQRVRYGKKTRTTRPNAAQPSSGERRGYRESRERLKQTGDVKDAAAAIAQMV